MRQNTLNLVDLDDAEAVREAEKVFEIKFARSELSTVSTVGEFYDLISDKYRANHPETKACLSQAAFYRLRSALAAMGANYPIAPATAISLLTSELAGTETIRRRWKALARRSGLTLPRLEVRWLPSDIVLPRYLAYPVWGVGYALFFGATAAIAKLTGMTFGWAFLCASASACLVLILASAILPAWCGDIPRRLETIGDLAREAAGRSFSQLRREKGKCGDADLWLAVIALLREVSGREGEINRETTFFAQPAAPKG